MKRLKVGIIGCGLIGSEITKACIDTLQEGIDLTALYDADLKKSKNLSKLVKKEISVSSVDELFEKSDLIVEAASSAISKDIVKTAIEKSKDVMVMSVGGLIDAAELLQEAEKKNVRVYLPSGAICGIDGIKAAKLSKIETVTLTTKKPSQGLEGAPYLEKNHIDLNKIKDEVIIFEGDADEAVRGFPKNINVASLLCLVGLGAKNTKVKIITSPDFKKNSHKIEVEGEFGKITTETQNVPSKRNPKTSELAFLSAIATLKGMVESVRMGT